MGADTRESLAVSFSSYLDKVTALGYNTVTLDDVAHLVSFDFYPEELKSRIAEWRTLFERLFSVAESKGVRVLLTTDLMFFNRHIDAYTSMRDSSVLHLLGIALRRLFRRFPKAAGIVVRLGESDGIDVDDEFRSRLIVRTPRQCRRYLRNLLPIFERYNRVMIVRTWSLGAYKIGDLMWNPKTYDKVFGGLVSRHLIVSLKFGDTDFFRYLDLNPLFFKGHHQKIVELQARREYEGFGEFPSFVGYDYEQYARQLQNCRGLVGVSVWCQTGGWSRFKRLTFRENSSVWNEINTFVSARVFREGESAEESIAAYCQTRFPDKDPELLVRLLSLSDTLVKQLWYLPEFSQKMLYFRRVRVPPLLWIFWDTILINHTLRKVLRRLVHRRREAIREGYNSLYLIREMKRLAAEMGLDTDTFTFQYDTFKIIALSREYFLGHWTHALGERIDREVKAYREKYPNGFEVEHDFSPVRVKKQVIKAVFKVCLRNQRQYRQADSLFVVRLTGWLYPLIRIWERRRMPEFTQKQAMGIQVLFK